MITADFKSLGINVKLVVSFLAMALVPMLVLSVIDSQIISGSIRKNSLRAMEDMATHSAMEIEAFIDASLNNIRTESLLPALEAYLEAPYAGGAREGTARDVLAALKKRDQVNIISYSINDREGRTLVSTTLDVTDTVARSRSVENYREIAARGIPAVSDVTFHPYPPIPSIFFTSPIRNSEGITVGFLEVRYNAIILQRIIHLNTIVTGDTSSAILVDDASILLANSAMPKHLYRPMAQLKPEVIRRLKEGMRLPRDSSGLPAGRFVKFGEWFHGKKLDQFFVDKLGVDNEIPMQCAAVRLKTKPWYVIFMRPEDEFLAAARQQRLYTALVLLVCSGVVAGFAFYIAKTISRPLADLTSAVDRIGRGDLQERVTVSGTDEIGRLGQAFNNMTESLGESRSRLMDATLRLHVILDTIPDAVFVHDAEGRILDVNISTGLMYGYTMDEIERLSVASISGRGHTQELAVEKVSTALRTGKNDFEWTGRKKDGTEFPLMVRLRSIRVSEEDLVIAVVTDVTELKKSEEEIKSSLREKETLLRELYHRTKNNMQVISSLLRLQAARIKDPEVLTLFREMENRIQSMALVHQKLYQSKTLSNIDLRDYLADLSALLMKSYQMNPGKVSVILDMKSVQVLIDTAIPCGLIVNELVSNSLKYAFPGDRSGEIRILLEKEGHIITLEVRDNGIGFPAGLNARETGTLGLKNVIGLAEFQLGGSVDIRSGDGVACRVMFTEERYEQRV